MAYTNRYEELMDRYSLEKMGFPFFHAFTEEQFAEGMRKLGLVRSEVDKLCELADSFFYLRKDADWLQRITDKRSEEHQAAIAGDATGDGYIYEMFLFVMENYESITTMLGMLGLTVERIITDKRLGHGLIKAVRALQKQEEEFSKYRSPFLRAKACPIVDEVEF